MEIAEETQGTTLVVRPAGRLDRTTSPELERLLLARIEGGAACSSGRSAGRAAGSAA